MTLQALSRRLKNNVVRSLRELKAAIQHRGVREYPVQVEDVTLRFSTVDAYSKHWFFSRCADGKLHEEPVTRLMLACLRESRCFVDVGTNLGWYTCLACKAMPQGTVYGFEMDDFNVRLLQANVKLNACHNVIICHQAVTDAPGPVHYTRPAAHPDPELSLSPEMQRGGETLSVAGVTLDDFFADKALPPDLIKIDVEGAELNVLHGMRGLMHSAAPALFVEIHPTKIGAFEATPDAVLALLLDNGYAVAEIMGLRQGAGQPELRPIGEPEALARTTMVYAREA